MKRLIIVIMIPVFFAMLSHGRSHNDYSSIVMHAETMANSGARTVLRTGRMMVRHRTIVRGSCWDYLNMAYTKAGYSPDKRKVIYKKSKRGPYASLSAVQPGDWLYYINHSYGNIEHSGMFIGWINKSKKQGLVLSYGGEHRNKPGRYRLYILSSIYQITRAEPE
jgi:hypothetical protein